MSQHTFSIANQAGAAFRADVNNALQALASQSSAATAPATMYAYQRWADTTGGVVKRRNAANSAWVLDGPLAETFAVPRAANTILALADYGKYFRATASFTQTLTAAATLGDGWWAQYRVDSGVTTVFDANVAENIDGAATKSVTGPASGILFCDATGFYTYGFGSASVTASTLGTSAMMSGAMINGTIVHSRAGNAETIAIKNLAGNDPSAGDPVHVIFRNVTPATGDYTVITLTAATSITISSGSTMGAANSVAFRLWLVGFNDAGTLRLGVINCLSGTSIYALSGWGIASSTAEGGAGAADSAQVFYTGTAVTSKAYATLGYSSWESGLAAVGTWGTAPTRVQRYEAAVPLPGNIVQTDYVSSSAVATGTTVVPDDDTIPQNTEGDQFLASNSKAPTSAANVLRIVGRMHFATSAGGGIFTFSLHQDTVADALKSSIHRIASANEPRAIDVYHEKLAGTTSALQFKFRGGLNGAGTTTLNGSAGARLRGGVLDSHCGWFEVMA